MQFQTGNTAIRAIPLVSFENSAIMKSPINKAINNHIAYSEGADAMFSTYTEPFLDRIQVSYHFTDLEMKRLKYTLKAVSSELVKTLLLALLFYQLGYFKEFFVGIIFLVTIRCNCGGLHMEHFTTCLLFTLVFMSLAVIILPTYVSISYVLKIFALVVCIAVTFIIGPIASKKRPPAPPEMLRRFRNITIGLLVMDSIIILLLKTNPYADICFWIIVLQTIQLVGAKLAQKGENNEKVQQ